MSEAPDVISIIGAVVVGSVLTSVLTYLSVYGAERRREKKKRKALTAGVASPRVETGGFAFIVPVHQFEQFS